MDTVIPRASTYSRNDFVIAGPFAPGDLIGRPAHDEGTLTLGQSSVYVVRAPGTDESDAIYTVFFGEMLGRRSLMDLLYAVAPYKAHGPDRFSRVLDNWGIIDRAANSSTSGNLLKQHEISLKHHWLEFSRHRELYMSIFQDRVERPRVLPVLGWTKTSSGTRRYQVDAPSDQTLRSLRTDVPVLERLEEPDTCVDSLLGLVCLPYLQPELSRHWNTWQPLVKDGKSNYIGPASVPIMSLLHRRALINGRLVRSVEELFDADLS